jgi:hypothetical protein
VQGSALFSPAVLNLLQQLIGGDTNTDFSQTVGKTGTENLNQVVSGTQDQTTKQEQTQQQTSRTTGTQTADTTQNQNQATTSTTQNIADVGNLQSILAQQMAGITPEALAAIFQEGSRAAPGLIAATSNAVGARAVNNDPMATALTELSARLTNQAALLDMEQRNRAATTAAEIARLTSGQQTTGTQQGTTTGTTASTSEQDVLSNLINNLLGSTATTSQQTTTADKTAAETGTAQGAQKQNTQLDTGNISKLLGGLLLGSAADSAIPGGLGGLATAGGNALSGILGPLLQSIGLGGPQQPVDPLWGQLGIAPDQGYNFQVPSFLDNPAEVFNGTTDWWATPSLDDPLFWNWDQVGP